MNTKSIAYAYPTSTHAADLGMSRSGAWFVCIQSRMGSQIAPNAQGYDAPNAAGLIEEYSAIDLEPCPFFKRHGNDDARRAVGLL